MGVEKAKILIVNQNWTIYKTLKLNGQFYSRVELLALADLKIKDSNIPDWEKAIYYFIIEWLDLKEFVSVKTSGSTGKPKNIEIEKDRMVASAKASNSFFSLDENKKALLCLSAEYIAGKMMIVRAFVGGFDLHYVEPKSDALLLINQDFDFTAVVPLQLESVFKANAIQSMKRIKKIIVGGAAMRQNLVQQLENIKTEVWATYGMTETLTHIALQRLNGKLKTDYFLGLPNVEFAVDDRSCLRIQAPLVNLYPVQTNDRVDLLDAKRFRFLGRVDFVINSGGIKYSPELLEQKLALYIENNFAFSSKDDELLGEKLILVIEGVVYSKEKLKQLNNKIKIVLDRFEQPKEILFMTVIPKTSNGKLDRIRLKDLIA